MIGPHGCSPLPWRAAGSETTLATWVERADGSRVCTMKVGLHDWHDAQLMAAAGDLYEVARGVRDKLCTYIWVFPGDKELRELLAKLDSAITKAEGR